VGHPDRGAIENTAMYPSLLVFDGRCAKALGRRQSD
jgi:hypothetical protein